MCIMHNQMCMYNHMCIYYMNTHIYICTYAPACVINTCACKLVCMCVRMCTYLHLRECSSEKTFCKCDFPWPLVHVCLSIWTCMRTHALFFIYLFIFFFYLFIGCIHHNRIISTIPSMRAYWKFIYSSTCLVFLLSIKIKPCNLLCSFPKGNDENNSCFAE